MSWKFQYCNTALLSDGDGQTKYVEIYDYELSNHIGEDSSLDNVVTPDVSNLVDKPLSNPNEETGRI